MGIEAPKIDTPKGGGALAGMGEKFSPDLFSGTGNFSVPIAVPAGRGGLQPQLTIGYSTGMGNSPWGLGWSLSIPGIMRKTSRGVPEYNDDKDVFILSGAEDLVKVNEETIFSSGVKHTKTFYRPRTEGLFARIIHHKKTNGENYWEVRTKDGMISYYGTPVVTPANDGCIIAKPDNRNKIFAWKLYKTQDVFGNHVIYEYQRDLVTEGLREYDQLYLKTIKYSDYVYSGNTKYLTSVVFNYSKRPDPFSEYMQGFEVRTVLRCETIVTYTHPLDADVPVGYTPSGTNNNSIKVKTYHFNYIDELVADGTLSPDEQPINGVSVLHSVKVEGHKKTDSEFMPPIQFLYSKFQPQKHRSFYPVKGKNLPPYSLSNPNYSLVDLFGNGLPDILEMNGPIVRYWRNLGNGEFDLPRFMTEAPAGFGIGDPDVQISDFNGDGKPDLFVNKPGIVGYFPLRWGGGWDKKSFQKVDKAPTFSFNDPEVRLMDLNGDGITDAVRNGARLECYINHPTKGFHETKFISKGGEGKIPDISFSDPRIRMVDMSGGGMQDIVLLTQNLIEYWPNMGHGNFGKKITMKNCPRLPFKFDPKRVMMGDIDGDGTTDVIYVEDNKITIWLNQSGNSFSQPIVIHGTPSVTDMDAVQMVDLNAMGVTGILWSYNVDVNNKPQMLYLDLNAGNKPYLLQQMTNNMGSTTKVEYTSSITDYLRDEKNPRTRWKTELPFPVLVVRRTEAIDEISLGKLTTEYSYRHGYWDGTEREFRGFGNVVQRDTESFTRYNENGLHGRQSFDKVTEEHYTPPIETRNWFHQGPIGDEFGGWFEADYSAEYWIGDPSLLSRPVLMESALKTLPRRAYRDALRTLRGSLLRSELYALDNSGRQNIPYTVTEGLQGTRVEYKPATPISQQDTFYYSSGYIFFPFGMASRTTQWERGNDPMTSFSFTESYDAFGQPLKQISIAIPRGMAPPYSGGMSGSKYLATYGESEFIYVGSFDEDDGIYMVNRALQAKGYDCTNSALLSVFDLKEKILADLDNYGVLISHSLNFYDGLPFIGKAFGQMDDYGVLVRSEALVITDDQVTNIYGSTIPENYKTTPNWSSYPSEFQSLLQNGNEHLGYLDKRTSGTPYIPDTEQGGGFYASGGGAKYDFQDPGITDPKGLMLEARDPFGAITTVEYDAYKFFPFKVTDPIGMETTAEYDYRSFQTDKVTDPNANIAVFDYSPLGLMKASAAIGKGTEGDYKGDPGGGFYNLYEPSSRMEYDFFNFMNNGDPVWVKTTLRQYHYQQSINNETIVKVDYSDGFGRLIQTRAQAEDTIYGDADYGSSGLPASQAAANANAVGVERDSGDPLNVVVSGWQVYNNKGLVVEKYEPFFSSGFDYEPPV